MRIWPCWTLAPDQTSQSPHNTPPSAGWDAAESPALFPPGHEALQGPGRHCTVPTDPSPAERSCRVPSRALTDRAKAENSSQPVISSSSSSWKLSALPDRCGTHDEPRTGTTSRPRNFFPCRGTFARSRTAWRWRTSLYGSQDGRRADSGRYRDTGCRPPWSRSWSRATEPWRRRPRLVRTRCTSRPCPYCRSRCCSTCWWSRSRWLIRPWRGAPPAAPPPHRCRTWTGWRCCPARRRFQVVHHAPDVLVDQIHHGRVDLHLPRRRSTLFCAHLVPFGFRRHWRGLDVFRDQTQLDQSFETPFLQGIRPVIMEALVLVDDRARGLQGPMGAVKARYAKKGWLVSSRADR